MSTIGIITPVKNEADNLPTLINSVVNQSLRPECWVIVNDGSSDGSTAIIDDAASQHSWIRQVEMTDTQKYDIGVHYAQVLSEGYSELIESYGDTLDYYMVLDGDMELSEEYIEAVSRYLDTHEDIPIACGRVYTRQEEGLEFEEQAENHPFGGATLYDGDFYRAIGGPPITPCVDSVTKAKANIRGFRPRYATELDVKAIQARPAHENGDPVENAKNLGKNNYAIGYPPIAAIARGGYLMTQSSIWRGVSYLRGYFSVWMRGDSRVADDDVVQYYYRKKPRKIVKSLRTVVEDTFPR